jgi:hypothetical protein
MTPETTDKPSKPSNKLATWFKEHWKGLLFVLLGIATFLALFIFVSLAEVNTKAAASTATAMLAIITATAVGIERAIETFWSLVGQLAHAWWPFNKMYSQVTDLETDVKSRLAKAQEAIDIALSKASSAEEAAEKGLTQAQEEIKKLNTRIGEIQKLAPGNQRVSLFAASVSQGIGMITQYQPQIEYNLRLVDQSVAGLTDFAASFKENPLRRIINIWAGAMLGMVVAYLVRFDIFSAVLGENSQPSNWWPHLSIALTGLIVGLGSNPTHDVIAALQEVKKYRASQNQPGPVVTEPAGGEVEAPEMGMEALPPMGVTPTPAGSRSQTSARPAPPVRRFR